MTNYLDRTLQALEIKYPTIHNHNEESKLLALVNQEANANRRFNETSILDVGCGHGKNMRVLITAGYQNITGIDMNEQTVTTNLNAGLRCYQASAFPGGEFDILLMIHVIEHMAPMELVEFMERYLGHLKPGGALVVSTPLIWEGFYQDFDHIKPYYPKGLLAVFGQQREQIAYYGRYSLQLEGDPWVRCMPHLIAGYKYFLMQPFTKPERFMQVALNALFYLSPHIFGKPNGWMALFRKSS